MLLQDDDDAPQRDAVALPQIDTALQRLAPGRYGQCVDCGQRIASARPQHSLEAAWSIPAMRKWWRWRPGILRGSTAWRVC